MEILFLLYFYGSIFGESLQITSNLSSTYYNLLAYTDFTFQAEYEMLHEKL